MSGYLLSPGDDHVCDIRNNYTAPPGTRWLCECGRVYQARRCVEDNGRSYISWQPLTDSRHPFDAFGQRFDLLQRMQEMGREPQVPAEVFP